MGLLVLGYLAFILIGLPDGIVGVAWPSVRSNFMLPDAGLGVVLAAMSLGHFLSGMVSGRLIQRMGAGGLLNIASTFMVTGMVAQAVSPVWPVLLIGAVLTGLGTGGIDGGLNTYAAGRWSPRQINWLHGCYGAGATTGPVVMSAALSVAGSWRAGYLVCSAATICAALAFLITRARWAAPGTQGGRGGADWRHALRHPLVPLHLGIFFCYTGLEVVLGQWSFTVLTEARGWSAPAAALWTSIYWGSLTAGRFGLGAVVGRVGPTRMIRLCMATTLAGAVLFALDLPQLGLVLAGGGLATIFPTMIARMPEQLGAGVALHAVGFMVGAAMVGSGALPAVAGLAASWFGLNAVGWAAAAIAVVMLGLHEAMLRRRPRAT